MQRIPEEISVGVQAQCRQHGARDQQARHGARHERDKNKHIEHKKPGTREGRLRKRSAHRIGHPTRMLRNMDDEHCEHGNSQPFVDCDARECRIGHHKVDNERHQIDDQACFHLRIHETTYFTFLTSITSATTPTIGARIHRFKLASDAW